jgi:hypothetical protein
MDTLAFKPWGQSYFRSQLLCPIVGSFPADERLAKLTQQFLIENSHDALTDACNQDSRDRGFSERFSRKDMQTAYVRSAICVRQNRLRNSD